MQIPFAELQPDTLRRLIEEYVSRDGSIQGHSEASLDEKIEAVMNLLKSGQAVIAFDPDDETCTILEKRSLGH